MIDEKTIKARVEQLLAQTMKSPDGMSVAITNEVYQGTVTIMQAIYGPNSSQEEGLRAARTHAVSRQLAPGAQMDILHLALRGILANLKAELDAGLVGTLQRRVTGDVLADLVRLARHVLDEQGEAGKDVAGVLAAAAYEDALRRIGAALANVPDGIPLADVITALKQAGVLVGPQVGVAQGYLNFRNRALHAQWSAVDLPTIKSALAFVEELLLKHLS